MDAIKDDYSEAEPFEYPSVEDASAEIRLVELLPGAFSDSIHIKIHQVRLPPSNFDQEAPPSATAEEIQKTLPHGWNVKKTIQGCFLFYFKRLPKATQAYDTSWYHPTTHERYESASSSLQSGVDYEALSYVWGSDTNGTVILVHDATLSSSHSARHSPKALNIRGNLDQALRHLRRNDSSRMLWVDAICINQEDTAERGRQVRHMGQVYQLARRVIVWLGPECDDSKLAISNFCFLGQQIEMIGSSSRIINSPDCVEPTWARSAVPLPYDQRMWAAIRKLLQRTWFERLWVLQESKLAKLGSIVQCGSDTIELLTFAKAAYCISAKRKSLPKEMSGLLSNARETTLPYTRAFLITLVDMHAKKCSDPKDKIYGALGIASSVIADQLVPNYSLSIEQIYRQACLVIAETTARSDFLVVCNLSKKTTLGPTWIPDWSDSTKNNHLRTLLCYGYASSISRSSMEVVNGSTTLLTIEGIKCGVIDSVSAKAPSDPARFANVLKEWKPENSSRRLYVTGESIFDAYVRTICWNGLRDRWPHQVIYPTLNEVKQLLEELWNPAQDTSHEHEDSIPYPLWQNKGRRFITLANGYFGQTVAAPSVNDVVCTVLGCPSPMILRPQSTGRYQVVGTAYVHGLMDAESLLGPLGPEWRITIRNTATSDRDGEILFYNSATNEETNMDPRLVVQPADWAQIESTRTPADPHRFVRYRHLLTGEIINCYPSLLPETLKSRNVPLESFTLE